MGDGQVLEHLKDKLRTGGGVRVFKGPFINNVILRGWVRGFVPVLQQGIRVTHYQEGIVGILSK